MSENLLKIEKHLIESCILRADDTYISDGYILIAKDFLNNKVLKAYKTDDCNLMESIPYERGADWELPEYARLFPDKKLAFEINADFMVNYKYIDLFCCSVSYVDIVTFSIVKIPFNGISEEAPILKVWNNEKFMGLIMSATTAIVLNKIEGEK